MAYISEFPIFSVTADVVLFTRPVGTGIAELSVLLIRRAHDPGAGMLALPGGFVDIDEDLKAAALRELQEETGVEGVGLSQLGAYGEPGRDPRGRTVSVVYLGEVTPDAVAALRVVAGDDAADAGWFGVSDVLDNQTMAFDHHEILRDARARLLGEEAGE